MTVELLRANGRVNWSKVVNTVIDDILPSYQSRGIAPSLREIYYRLVALGLPNTNSTYQQLSSHLVDARMGGEISWDSINDESRSVYNGNIPDYVTPLEYVEMGIEFLEDCHHTYKNRIPRWHCQRNYVEVWTEKRSIVGTIMSFIGDRQVRIVPVSGFDGWGDAYKHSERLKDVKRKALRNGIDIKIHILYLGDFDPSGKNIDEHLRQQLNYFSLSDVQFRRIAVTQDQIRKYQLPSKPTDEKTLQKLKNDSRTKGFISRYGELYAVEVEALTAFVMDEFEKLVQAEVDNLYDNKIYEELLNKPQHKPENISRLVQKKVRFSEDE
jgi:hypothetical protein